MFERVEAAVAEPLLGECAELGERAFGDWFEAARLGREDDAERAPVVGVLLAADQLLAFEQAHHGRHRLFAEAGAAGELAHPQPVLFEKWDEDGAVAWAHVVPAGGAEALL